MSEKPETTRPNPPPEIPQSGSRAPLDPTSTTVSQMTGHMVRRAQDGSMSVWAEIDVRYRQRLLALTEHLLGPHLRSLHDPEDAVNEVLAQTWNRIDVFQPRGSGSFYAWMCLQLRRLVQDWARREQARTPRNGQRVDLEDLGGAPTPENEAPHAGLEHRDEIRRIVEALEDSRLPGIYREVLVAVDLELRDRREAAAELGISDELLRKRLLRGRKKWSEILGGDPFRYL